MSPTPAERRAERAARVARGAARPDAAPAQTKTTSRSTVDLALPRHRALNQLAEGLADALGEVGVSRQDVLATAVEILLADGDLGEAVRGELERRIRALLAERRLHRG